MIVEINAARMVPSYHIPELQKRHEDYLTQAFEPLNMSNLSRDKTDNTPLSVLFSLVFLSGFLFGIASMVFWSM